MQNNRELNESFEKIKEKLPTPNIIIEPSKKEVNSAFKNEGFVKVEGDKQNLRYEYLKSRIAFNRQNSASSDTTIQNTAFIPMASSIFCGQTQWYGNAIMEDNIPFNYS